MWIEAWWGPRRGPGEEQRGGTQRAESSQVRAEVSSPVAPLPPQVMLPFPKALTL